MGVEVQVDNGLAVIRMDWPEKRNSLRPEDADAIVAAMDAHEAKARVVVLTGTPGSFCAGADLPAILGLVERGAEAVRERIYGTYQRLVRRVREARALTIAAVDGPAIGFGADLALACDHRYVGDRGWFRQGWSGLEVIPGTGGAWLVRHLGGATSAWEFLLSRDRWNGPQLDDRGLAIAVAGMAVEHARERGAWFAALARDTADAYISLMREAPNETFVEHLSRCLEYQVGFLTSPDFPERARRVLEATKK